LSKAPRTKTPALKGITHLIYLTYLTPFIAFKKHRASSCHHLQVRIQDCSLERVKERRRALPNPTGERLCIGRDQGL
jgi:hypothetical protein